MGSNQVELILKIIEIFLQNCLRPTNRKKKKKGFATCVSKLIEMDY